MSNSWHGGTNGISLRKVSKVKRALKRLPKHFSLDMGYGDPLVMQAIENLPGSVVPTPEKNTVFAMESDWSERPMAYHPTISMIKQQPGWLKENGRRGIFDHCPEVKIIMDMKLKREKCPVAQDKSTEELAKAKAEADRAALMSGKSENVIAEKLKSKQEEKDRKLKEEKEKVEQEKAQLENAEKEKIDKEKAEMEKAEKEKEEKDKAEVENFKQEMEEAEYMEKAKLEGEMAMHEQAENGNATEKDMEEAEIIEEEKLEGGVAAHEQAENGKTIEEEAMMGYY